MQTVTAAAISSDLSVVIASLRDIFSPLLTAAG
jgi:hypothetical protein